VVVVVADDEGLDLVGVLADVFFVGICAERAGKISRVSRIQIDEAGMLRVLLFQVRDNFS
jgi:hypothetical protein